jgi:cytochrome c
MVGPSLWNVVGRQQAALENYDYSGAFERLDGIWSFESLNMLLLDSNNYFPGNKMNKTNRLIVSEIQDRADIISFLRLQSNEPVPLP